MGDAITVVKLLENVGNVSALVLVIIAAWAFFSGRVPTPREYDKAEELARQEREEVKKKDAEARAAYERLDKLTATMDEQTATMTELKEFMESVDQRLNMLGVPKDETRRRRWPWKRLGGS